MAVFLGCHSALGLCGMQAFSKGPCHRKEGIIPLPGEFSKPTGFFPSQGLAPDPLLLHFAEMAVEHGLDPQLAHLLLFCSCFTVCMSSLFCPLSSHTSQLLSLDLERIFISFSVLTGTAFISQPHPSLFYHLILRLYATLLFMILNIQSLALEILRTLFLSHKERL